jgi:galactokinase
MTSAELTRRFEDSFGAKPRIFCAPGRVNLLGEHTDYNDGFVMPCAIGFSTRVAISSRPDRKLVVQSEEFSEKFEFDLDSLPIMQQAWRTRLAAAKVGFDMGVPFNELNRVFDLGFTPLPWGDQGYLPSQLQPLPDAAPGKQYTPLGSPRNQNGIPTSPK